MTNRIVDIDVRTHRISSAAAELWVVVTAERTTPGTAVRGRFVGPKCPLSSTVEVAYPLQSFPHRPPDLPPIAMRVVIPEPSFWEPECPFVYDGVVELWQDGERCNVRQVPAYRLLTASSTSSRSP
jgi:hypothetical protein